MSVLSIVFYSILSDSTIKNNSFKLFSKCILALTIANFYLNGGDTLEINIFGPLASNSPVHWNEYDVPGLSPTYQL